MKTTTIIKRKFEKLTLLTVMFFSSLFAFAQETAKTADAVVTTTTTTTKSEEWIANPLYWAVGAVVLLLVIVLLTRGNKKD